MKFYLGTHHPHWLGRLQVPLFVSRRTLAPRRSLPRASETWALDSGGFSELSMHGRWTVGAKAYASEVRRFRDEIGFLEWAAIQDWMCEPQILKKTNSTIKAHQLLTVWNLRDLQDADPEMPWVPVLQGWEADDYLRHADLYTDYGHDLSSFPVVGLGSVCRRQGMSSATDIVRRLTAAGFKLHGFGFKLNGLRQVGALLQSADSMAWSYAARRREVLRGCRHGKSGAGNCANCPFWAAVWRKQVLEAIEGACR